MATTWNRPGLQSRTEDRGGAGDLLPKSKRSNLVRRQEALFGRSMTRS